MRKFKIRKVKTTKIFTRPPEQDRVQFLTNLTYDLGRYSTAEMPEIETIKAWADKELKKSFTRSKVQNLFSPQSKSTVH
ncbi:MAG: hypothetical protein WD231_03460 [Candidatus Woykebacteria bacterium]